MKKVLVLFFVLVLAISVSASFFYPDYFIYINADVNGEDLNVNNIWANDIVANNIDANSISINYIVARNTIDFNVVNDINAWGMVESLGGFVSDLFCSFSDRENCLDLSGSIWQLNNAGLFVDGDLTGFDVTAQNNLNVLNDLDVTDDADIHGTLTADELILASGGIDAGDDSNFTVVGVSDSVFVNNNIYASRLFDKFGFGWLDLTGDPYSFQGVDVELTQDLGVQGDTNVVSLGISGQTFALDFVNLHADPELPLHAATKEYVDIAVSGIEFDFFLTDSASGIGGDYFDLVDGETGEPISTNTSVALAAGLDQEIFNYATVAGQPEFDTLLSSVYDGHFHILKTGGASKTVFIYWSLYQRNILGTETLIMDSENSKEVTTSQQSFDIHGVLAEDTMIDGNRIVLKVFANVIGGGGSVQIVLAQEGILNSRVSLRPPNTALQQLFVLRSGSNWMTGDFNLGGFTLQNGDVNASGDSNFVNIGVSAGSFLNRLFVSGDANFVTGISLMGGSLWNVDKIECDNCTASGINSVALGSGSVASGDYSTALGKDNIANQDYAVALGNGTLASGVGSFTVGVSFVSELRARNTGGFAFGSAGFGDIISENVGAFAGGSTELGDIIAGGNGSVALGFSDSLLTATGKGAIALGYNVQSLAEASVTLGKDLTNYNANSLLVRDLNVLGDLNVANFSVSGVSFLDGGIIATGDSNFVNIGISENLYVDGNVAVVGNVSLLSGQINITDTGLVNQIAFSLQPLFITGGTSPADTAGLPFQGQGGMAGAKSSSGTADEGGDMTFNGGIGGFSLVGGTNNIGGEGGAFEFAAGTGGAAASGSEDTIGGAGGLATLSGGIGGSATESSIVPIGGAGGNSLVQGGAGGTALNFVSDGLGGDGGDAKLIGGTGGFGNGGFAGGTDGDGGDVNIYSGAGGVNGNIYIGTVRGNVRIGGTARPAPISQLEVVGDLNVTGDFNVSGKAAFNGLRNWNAGSVVVNDLNVVGDLNATNFSVSGVSFADGGIIATGDSNFTNIGVSGNSFLNALFASTINATNITATNLTGTLQTAAQGNVTSLGTLTNLQVDNININGAVISSNTGAISFSNENLVTTGEVQASTMEITAPTGSYMIKGRGPALAIQQTSTGQNANLGLYSAAGTGTKDVLFRTWKVGTPTSVANSEYMEIGYNLASDLLSISTRAIGSGVVQPLHLFTLGYEDQLVLKNNGNNTMSGNLDVLTGLITSKQLLVDDDDTGVQTSLRVFREGKRASSIVAYENQLDWKGTSSPNTVSLIGMQSNIRFNPSSSGSIKNANELVSIIGISSFKWAGGGDVAKASIIRSLFNGDNSYVNIIGEVVMFEGLATDIGGAGEITEMYGLKLPDITFGETNWAIKTGLGKVAFGDDTSVNGDFNVSGKVAFNGLRNWNENSVVVQDLNVVGVPYFDGNFFIKRETDSVVFNCGIDAVGDFKCY